MKVVRVCVICNFGCFPGSTIFVLHPIALHSLGAFSIPSGHLFSVFSTLMVIVFKESKIHLASANTASYRNEASALGKYL